MSDLLVLLPDFPSINKYNALIAGLETHRVSVSELLTLDAAEIGKRTRLPLLDLQRLCDEVRAQLLLKSAKPAPKLQLGRTDDSKKKIDGGRISTLDPALDAALGGGFPAGVLSEVVGESGVGKTQLLLSLLVAVQLPPPRGLGRKALYIATEAPLATNRLTQIMRNNADSATLRQHCSLQSIVTINVPDLEAQEHILTHQLPVQLSKAEQYGGGVSGAGSFGLVVLDSVAANFRPFFGGGVSSANQNNRINKNGASAKAKGDSAGNGGAKGSTSLAARSLELQRLGMLLRTLALKHNLAVVVANQVADRFNDNDDMDGGDGGSSLLSLSQQWGGAAGAATRNTNGSSSVRLKQSVPSSSAKRLRQEGPGGDGRPAISLTQPLSASHSLSLSQDSHPLTLTQESPLVARSRKQQQEGDGGAADTKTSMLPPRLPVPKNEPPEPMPFPPSSQYIPPSQYPPPPPAPPVLQLDHQQRWFTGWGDSPGFGGPGGSGGSRNKTPSLGIVWAIQLGMRVALIKAPRLGRSRRYPGERNYLPGPHDNNDNSGGGGALDNDEEEYTEETEAERHNMGAPRLRHSWRRWMKVVFAPHVASTGATGAAAHPTPIKGKAPGKAAAVAAQTHRAVEFEITMGGLQALDN